MNRCVVVLFLLFLLLLPVAGVDAAEEGCRKVFINPLTNGQCRTVGATAVDVLLANTSRCSALIFNNSTNVMMCSDFAVNGAPTSTNGFPVNGGQTLTLGEESQGRWQCIRAAAADATACIAEGRP